MAQYKLTIDQEVLNGLFQGDQGVARLLQDVLNQVLEAQATEHLRSRTNARRTGWGIGMDIGRDR